MAPPWVTFDSIALYNGNCADGADPDIAGLGVRIGPHPNNMASGLTRCIGRSILRHCQFHDNAGLHPRDDPRPDLRLERSIHTTSANQILPRAVSGHWVETGLCLEAVP
jgi:hypothetical protein